VPIEDWGIGEQETYQVHDLIGTARYLWHGRRNPVRLDPQQSPAQVFKLRRRGRSERDFDYFI
jgi:starch synthase (maltosyl-transferring)